MNKCPASGGCESMSEERLGTQRDLCHRQVRRASLELCGPHATMCEEGREAGDAQEPASVFTCSWIKQLQKPRAWSLQCGEGRLGSRGVWELFAVYPVPAPDL